MIEFSNVYHLFELFLLIFINIFSGNLRIILNFISMLNTSDHSRKEILWFFVPLNCLFKLLQYICFLWRLCYRYFVEQNAIYVLYQLYSTLWPYCVCNYHKCPNMLRLTLCIQAAYRSPKPMLFVKGPSLAWDLCYLLNIKKKRTLYIQWGSWFDSYQAVYIR